MVQSVHFKKAQLSTDSQWGMRFLLSEHTIVTADKTVVWRREVGWIDKGMCVQGSVTTELLHALSHAGL